MKFLYIKLIKRIRVKTYLLSQLADFIEYRKLLKFDLAISRSNWPYQYDTLCTRAYIFRYIRSNNQASLKNLSFWNTEKLMLGYIKIRLILKNRNKGYSRFFYFFIFNLKSFVPLLVIDIRNWIDTTFQFDSCAFSFL